MRKNRYIYSEKRRVECLCPYCGTSHMKYLFWSGHSQVPRLFCDVCRKSGELDGDLEEYRLGVDDSKLVKMAKKM